MASPVDRFIIAAEHAPHGSDITDKGIASALALLREAEPIARAMAMFGHPLDVASPALGRFCDERRQKAIADPDQYDEDGSIAARQAAFFVGLALGLLLGDRV